MLVRYKREIKIFFYILILAIIFLFIFKSFVFSFTDSNFEMTSGKLDLSKHNFNSSSSLSLGGNWEIYLGKLYNHKDFELDKVEKPLYSKLLSWNKLNFSNEGSATYRALIKKSTENTEFVIKLSNMYTSYKLYINGFLVNGIGNPALENQKENIKVIGDYHLFTVQGEIVEIIIHVTNTHNYIGGMISAPVIGTVRNMQLSQNINIAMSIFMITSLFIISIFIFSFYMAKDEENSAVYLGFASISYIMKILISPNGPMYFIYYTIPYLVIIKCASFFEILMVYFIFDYFRKTFYHEKEKISLIIKIILQIYMIIIIVSPEKIMSYFNIYSIILTTIVYLYCFVTACNDLFKYKKEAVFNFSGAIILLISFSLDIDNLGISMYRITGLFIFCSLILVNIVKDYISTYNNLQQIKYSLEVEVENRTIELVAVHNNLQKETQARIIAEETLKNNSNIDEETGIFNSLYAKNYVDDLISLYYRHKQIFSIILIDFDDAAYIKKTFGQSTSKKVVSETILIIKTLLRRTDLLAKWDGETFIIIMPNCLEKNAINVAEKLRDVVSENIIEGLGTVTVSLGIVAVSENDTSISILAKAEHNLNNAKSISKGSIFPTYGKWL